jgi:drug/metabolite transporter (DMT)-like permease
MQNISKKLFKSIFKGIATALLVGIYAVGICILYLFIRQSENWEFTLVLIIIAFFSSIYYYNKEE